MNFTGQYYDGNSCIECPMNTYKSKEGTEGCTPCPQGTITGNKTGSIDQIDCYLDCQPGEYYSIPNGGEMSQNEYISYYKSL